MVNHGSLDGMKNGLQIFGSFAESRISLFRRKDLNKCKDSTTWLSPNASN